jgi:hypothetical protein
MAIRRRLWGPVRDVLDGTAPAIGCGTVIEAQLLAGLASRALGDRGAADQSTERALALAEADTVLGFAILVGLGVTASGWALLVRRG